MTRGNPDQRHLEVTWGRAQPREQTVCQSETYCVAMPAHDQRPAYGLGVPETELPRDHFVSRGYQQNFASPDKRVAVISTASGRVIDVGRPIKSNSREQGFTTFLEAGVPNDLLERAFVSVERQVLNEIRNIGVDRCGPQQKADVANLFAIHLVRSPAFKTSIATSATDSARSTCPRSSTDRVHRAV